MRRARVIAAFALASCTLDTGIFAGKTCNTDVDCPTPYTCAQVRPETRSCELLRGPDEIDTSGDNPAYYCSGPDGGPDVFGVVVRSCVRDCHGTNMSYPGVPQNFRLDIYASISGALGAFSQREQMTSDVDNGLMPPNVAGVLVSTADDKALLRRWVSGGGLFHPDGVAVGNDCTVLADAGTPDAGDGGP